MAERGRWTGLLQVLRYNAHLYALALLAEVAAAAGLAALPPAVPARAAVAAGAVLGLAWAAASLAVSHYVYDRSPLYRWRWLAEVGPPPLRWVSVHAGLDDSSPALAERYGVAGGRVLDIFSAGAMPERSIARARGERACRRAEAADFRRLPLADARTDATLRTTFRVTPFVRVFVALAP